jgi:hypothetical protein
MASGIAARPPGHELSDPRATVPPGAGVTPPKPLFKQPGILDDEHLMTIHPEAAVLVPVDRFKIGYALTTAGLILVGMLLFWYASSLPLTSKCSIDPTVRTLEHIAVPLLLIAAALSFVGILTMKGVRALHVALLPVALGTILVGFLDVVHVTPTGCLGLLG